MEDKVLAYMVQENMLPEDGRRSIAVALSGGADSVCLLLVLKALGKRMNFELSAIHVEHGIRGQESLADTAFVENLCEKEGIDIKVVHVDVPAYAKENSLGLEEAARLLRYEALREYAMEGHRIALAHHMEDQAETLLFQLVRGSGVTGLGGMSPVSNTGNEVIYLRPLLSSTRMEIEAYLKAAKQDYCQDSTNSDLAYSRNYIRNVILPELTKLNAQAILHMNQTADMMRQTADYLEGEAIALLKDTCDFGNHTARILCGELLDAQKPIAKEMVRQILFQVAGKQKDITAKHVEAVLDLCSLQSGKELHLPYKMVAKREFDLLLVEKTLEKESSVEKAEHPGEEILISAQDIETLKGDFEKSFHYAFSQGESIKIQLVKTGGRTSEIPKKAYTKWVSYDKIKGGFVVRNRREKDFLVIDDFGHKKKIKQYFIEEKIPASQRSQIFLLAQESQVIWVLGHRLSDAYKVTEEDDYALMITYNGGTESGS